MKRIITTVFCLFALLMVSEAQTTLIKKAPPQNATTGSRVPNGSAIHAYFRASTIVRASELTGIAPNTTMTVFGYNAVQGANQPVTGTLKVYMSNTASTTYANGKDWSVITAGMTLVYNGPFTIPTQPGPQNITLTTPFNYTGQGIYVAYEFVGTAPFVANVSDSVAIYEANASLANSLFMRASATPFTSDILTDSTAFRPAFNLGYPNPNVNEAAIIGLTTLSQVKTAYTAIPVQVVIKNQGSASQSNLPVTLNITGANTFTNQVTINSLAPGADTVINFLFIPTSAGVNNITVTIPSDEILTNNSATTSLYQEFTCNVLSYSDTSQRAGSVGFNTGSGLFLAKYVVPPTATETVNAVNIFMGSSGIGNQVFAVVVDQTGAVVGRSDTITITAADTSDWKTFTINNPVAFTGGLTGYTYYVGLAQLPATPGYYPLGYQARAFVPSNTFYTTGLNGGNPAGFTNYTTIGVWMIEAVLAVPASQLPPTPGTIAGQAQICAPETAVTFTVPAVTGATSYVWTVPVGATIVGTDNTNTITVDFAAGAVTGPITVAGVNDCGPGPVSTFNVAVNDEPTAAFTKTTSGYTYDFTNTSTSATTYLWDFGTGDTTSVASPSYTFTQNGTFNICLTAINGGCTDQICESVTITGVGINNVAEVVSRVFPNPAKDVLTIEIVKGNALQAVMYNSIGQVVLSGNIEKGMNNFNITTVPAGVYHLYITGDDFTNTSRIVIQK